MAAGDSFYHQGVAEVAEVHQSVVGEVGVHQPGVGVVGVHQPGVGVVGVHQPGVGVVGVHQPGVGVVGSGFHQLLHSCPSHHHVLPVHYNLLSQLPAHYEGPK